MWSRKVMKRTSLLLETDFIFNWFHMQGGKRDATHILKQGIQVQRQELFLTSQKG